MTQLIFMRYRSNCAVRLGAGVSGTVVAILRRVTALQDGKQVRIVGLCSLIGQRRAINVENLDERFAFHKSLPMTVCQSASPGTIANLTV